MEAKKRLGWEGKQVLFLGRLHKEKGADILLDAWKRLSSYDDWHLMIAGSGSEESELRKMAGENGIENTVHFVGETSEPCLMLRAADIVVVPSRSAAFELVAVEAMAAGTPVIVSDADALPEVAGDAALTFRNEDANALADKLNQIMQQ